MSEKKIEIVLDWLSQNEEKFIFNKSDLELFIKQLEEHKASYIEITNAAIGKRLNLHVIKTQTEIERCYGMIEEYHKSIKQLENRIEKLK